MKTTYQISRGPFSVALIAADSAAEALVAFLAEKAAGKYRADVTVSDDGVAEVEYEGVTYRAAA